MTWKLPRNVFDIFLVNSESLLSCAATIYLVLVLELMTLPKMDYMYLDHNNDTLLGLKSQKLPLGKTITYDYF